MRNIEAQLHEIFLDLFPDNFNSNHQAKIIAEATDIFLKNENKRTSAKNGESGLVKAVWAAMSNLGFDDLEDNSDDYVDGFGLDPNQIVRQAVSSNIRINNKLNKMAMEVLNDDDLSVFLDEEIENEYNLSDATDDYLHPEDAYSYKGMKKHHTDSRVTPG